MIEFAGVSKWYGQVSALTDVTFRIDAEAGITGLVGRNGAGKSTLIKLAVGLLRPSQGQVTLGGRSPHRADVRRELGFCPDIDSFYEELSGHEFVTWMLRATGTPRREARERAAAAFERLALADAMHRAIRGYSKGMRQRVKLAQAIAHGPRVLFLDEPMTGLDPVARHQLAGILRSLADEGVAIVVSSHVLHELEALAERVLFIHQGRLMAEGTVAELRSQLEDRPHHLFLRSRQPRDLAARLARVTQIHGLTIRAEGVDVQAEGGRGLFDVLTRLGADADELVDEITPLDDNLEAVFGYLVS